MLRLLVDEDLPRSLAPAFRAAGHEATDVRDEGLRGQPDERVYRFAPEGSFAVLTGDIEFGNELVDPPASHRVVLTRFPNDLLAPMLVRQIVAGLALLGDEDLAGAIVIIEPGRVRVRRSAKP